MSAPPPAQAGGAVAAARLAEVEQSIPRRFEHIAGLHPDRTALGSGDWQPTYAELNFAANRVALAILSRGGAIADRVAVLMAHDAPQVAAVLSILKAGRVVVVMNPSDPPARLAQVVEDAEPHLVLTDALNEELALQLTGGPGGVLLVGRDVLDGHAEAPGLGIPPDAAAFIVYTSGSTGRPKGIVQNHRNILHNVWRLSRGLRFTPDDRILLPASLSGGHGVATVWCALMNGAALCPFAAMERGVTGLADWVNAHRISVLVASASLFRHFARSLDGSERFPGVRVVRLGSEMATPEDLSSFRRHFPAHSFLFHTLSSSETGNISQAHFEHGDQVVGNRLPVGYAAEGVEVLLLDEDGREVPPGDHGEIVVRSRYLSPGYWKNPALTAERFERMTGHGDLRLYRTGDLGRLNEHGALVFVGRKDAQVKIRGYRVELSEIEDALLRQDEVDKAAVCARAKSSGDGRLIAYVVAHRGKSVGPEILRDRLRTTMPGYMVPTAFVFLEQLPLTPHGKVDREKLRGIPVPEPAAVQEDPPVTATEVLLAEIWCRELKCDRVVRQSDFFELGGDSLSAAVVAARIHATLRLGLDLRVFLAHPRLAGLAAEIDRLRAERNAEVEVPFVRVSRDEPLPLSFAQERTWRSSHTEVGPTGYTVVCSHRIRGPLRVDLLRECIGYLSRRHDMLRTTFQEMDGKPVQVVHPSTSGLLPLTDLSAAPEPEKQATALLQAEGRQPFDLACGPLLRLQLVRLRPDEHWLIRANHHIISDRWSWNVYFRELAQLYEARLQGTPPPLPEFEPLQYADYAAWQRRMLEAKGAAYQEAVQWWFDQMSDRPRPVEPRVRRFLKRPRADLSEGVIWWGLEPVLSQRLDELRRGAGATYYGIRLAALAALLADECGESNILLGTYVTNRTRVESQNMFGFFSNLASLRLRFDRTLTFRAWIEVAQGSIAEMQARSEIPYELLWEELRGRGVKLPGVDTIFTVSDSGAPLRFGGLELSGLDRHVEVPGGFSVTFDQHDEAHRCRVVFDPHRYHPVRVRRFIGRLVRFLDEVSGNPDVAMVDLLRRGGGGSWLSRLLRR